MRERIPAARLEVIEDAGHMITMEAPQAVAEAIAAWLTEDSAAIRRDPGRARRDPQPANGFANRRY